MEKWITKPLGDIATVGAGNSAPQDKRLFDGGKFPFFRTSDVGRVHVGTVYDAEDKLNEKGIERLSLYPVGTILLPKSGASTFLDHRVMLGVEGYVSSHLATIRAKPEVVDAKYLFYFLLTVEARLLGVDAAYPTLSLAQVCSIKIPLPSLLEQKRIVATLDQALTELEIAEVNAEKNLKNTGELFDSYLQNVMVNEHWRKKHLDEVVDGRCSLSYGVVQPGNEQSDGIPVVRPVDLIAKVINSNGLKRIDPSRAQAYGRTKLKGGELLLCVRGSTGVVSIAGNDLAGANVTRGIVPVLFDPLLMTQRFGYYALCSKPVQAQIREKTYGAALMQINIRDLRNLVITVPPLKDQERIAARLDTIFDETLHLEELYRKKRKLLLNLREALLRKAFSGELTAPPSRTMREAAE